MLDGASGMLHTRSMQCKTALSPAQQRNCLPSALFLLKKTSLRSSSTTKILLSSKAFAFVYEGPADYASYMRWFCRRQGV